MTNFHFRIALVAVFAALAASAAPAIAQFTVPSSAGAKPPTLPPGLYVQVIDGAIFAKNAGGTQNFAAGQFGFTPSVTQPPVMVPKNPAIQFTPPPVFNNVNVPGSMSANGSAAKGAAVDCEVR